MTFTGLLTALATPFVDGAVDEATFRAFVGGQVEGGVDGLVPCGTTGEAPTLTTEEQHHLIRWTVEEAEGRPVLAGVGGNCTASVVENVAQVAKLGVQGVLATAPYYNKPTQEGLFQHFRAIAQSTDREVCLYDVPGRSVVRLAPETIERLAAFANITTIKDATGDLVHLTEVKRRTGDRFSLLSGDDFTVLPFLALGGQGTISVASNVDPVRMKVLVDAVLEGDLLLARSVNDALYPLFHALFCEANPNPLKAALAVLGMMNDELRLPMTSVGPVNRARVVTALEGLGLA